MKIIPEEITAMTIVLAGRCGHCGHWVGQVIKEYESPFGALAEEDWPDLECRPAPCCDPQEPVWPTHFMVIYQGEILDQRVIGGEDLPVTRRQLQ